MRVPLDAASVREFRYLDVTVDAASGTVTSRWSLDDDLIFEEVVHVPDVPPERWQDPSVMRAVTLLFLLSGVSYYKAAAPPVIDLGDTPVRSHDRAMLEQFFVDGLGEYAFVNDLDLTGLRFVGGRDVDADPRASYQPNLDRPLIAFGGGIDSIVTLESLKARVAEPTLFVLQRGSTSFQVIDDAAAASGVPVIGASQHLDEKILRSGALGFRNGHVPVTGVLSAIAVLTALLHGHGAVVMSNEWSASIGNTEHAGRSVNHQWSKSLAFEDLFRASLAAGIDEPPAYYSYLRARSEVWVAQRMAAATAYHSVFRSCNRSFAIDPAQRLDRWCGRCDKCVFINLVLAPFMSRAQLAAVFGGSEPLDALSNEEALRTLVGASPDAKPFECVGDVDECRVAAVLAADRPERADQHVLQRVVAELGEAAVGARAATDRMLAPLGPDRVPDAHAG
jgi:hypothetical protein